MALNVVFFSDTHLGFDFPIRPRSDRPRSDRPRRGADFFANFQRVLDHARDVRADLLIHGGDVFFRSKVHPVVVDLAYQALFDFADSGIPVAIVPGNHERSVLPPSLLLNHPGIHVFDRPRTFHFDLAGERLAVSGFPYLKNVRRHFRAAVEECGRQPGGGQHHLLCVHHAVDGAVVGPGSFTFRGGADVIAQAQVPQRCSAILAGHVHRHQVLEYGTPVAYCGSVERTSYAEKDEPKGFCEVTLHEGAPPDIVFRQLPTRTMIDFDGRSHTGAGVLLDAVAECASGWPDRSIVRIRLADYPGARLAQALKDLVPGMLSLSVSRTGVRTPAAGTPGGSHLSLPL